uniref:Putative ovule protein n=1 Tax=Solanum chacoense TaxID=4108 RepID=A0A0V0H402_SOLCH
MFCMVDDLLLIPSGQNIKEAKLVLRKAVYVCSVIQLTSSFRGQGQDILHASSFLVCLCHQITVSVFV